MAHQSRTKQVCSAHCCHSHSTVGRNSNYVSFDLFTEMAAQDVKYAENASSNSNWSIDVFAQFRHEIHLKYRTYVCQLIFVLVSHCVRMCRSTRHWRKSDSNAAMRNVAKRFIQTTTWNCTWRCTIYRLKNRLRVHNAKNGNGSVAKSHRIFAK